MDQSLKSLENLPKIYETLHARLNEKSDALKEIDVEILNTENLLKIGNRNLSLSAIHTCILISSLKKETNFFQGESLALNSLSFRISELEKEIIETNYSVEKLAEGIFLSHSYGN